jgi:peroxiredoxin
MVTATGTDIANVVLQDGQGHSLRASELWSDGPVLLLVLRRPGCALCRQEVQQYSDRKAEYAALGVKIGVVLKEWKPEEVESFQAYWDGPVYLDSDMALYKTVHGGKLRKNSVLNLLNPAVWARGRRASKDIEDSNFKGEGLILGGLMVVDTSGKIVYSFAEQDFGVHAPQDEVLAACKAAAKGNNTTAR